MKIIKSVKQMSLISKKLRGSRKTIGFILTMGYLHEGHISLIRKARKENNIVVVSIYVNPAQFGPKEDFKKYPRNIKMDTTLCEKCGVDIIFAPSDKDMYPQGYVTYINVEKLSEGLCGTKRPGHFKGVTTVVSKLFNIVKPSAAYFGQKDAQQALIINKMAQDLNMGIKIKIMPTVREPGGLAMSSRNAYLSVDEKKDALVLYKALQKAKSMIESREYRAKNIVGEMRRLIKTKKSIRIDYIEIVSANDLKPVDKIKRKVLIALAVFTGKTRLIDNMIVRV